VNCAVVPFAIVAFGVVTAIETRVAGAVTVIAALLVMVPLVAVMVVPPAATPVATPVAAIEAVAGAPEVQVTVDVTSFIVPSL
jgi:hypothetical protein